ncbi:MAG: HlyD family type I secretion periplasmic adaptor subunit, partial [Pontibacterium sp.]
MADNKPSAEATISAIKPRARAKYLAQAIELEEPKPSFLAPALIFATLLIMVALITWSGFTRVNEVAVAQGEVVPAGLIRDIQHLDGGIISRVHVRNGDPVVAGQLLLSFDPATSDSELLQMLSRRASLLLQGQRLNALIEGRVPKFSLQNGGYQDLIERQRTIYVAQVNSHRSERAVIDSQMQQRRQELTQRKNQVTSLQKELAIHKEQVAIREESVVKGSVSKSELLSAKSREAETANQLKQAQDGVVVAREAYRESVQRKKDLIARFERDLELEAGQVGSELAEVESTLIRLQARDDRQEVRAPIDGIVQGLMASNDNAVVSPGQVIMQIVPTGEEMIVEAKILPQDIGHVSNGQSAKLKFVSYDFSRFGTLTGEVVQISPSTYLDEEGQPYYRAEIALQKAYLGKQPGDLSVLPGMTLTADIQTGDKTLLEYLLRPVTRGLANA